MCHRGSPRKANSKQAGAATGLRSVIAGENDMAINIDVQLKPVADRAGNLVARLVPTTFFWGAYINFAKPPLDNLKVRQALAWGIDRVAMNKAMALGLDTPGNGVLPKEHWACDPATFNMYGYAPDKARKLLAEAGYPHGAGFPKINIFINTSEAHRTIAEAIQQMWKSELGIQVGITNQEWKVYLDTITKHNFDVARLGWIGDLDPIGFLDTLRTGSPDNISNWSNPQFDALMQHLAPAFEQAVIGHLLHQRVLEAVAQVGWSARAE